VIWMDCEKTGGRLKDKTSIKSMCFNRICFICNPVRCNQSLA
jgi:hypothetical protein